MDRATFFLAPATYPQSGYQLYPLPDYVEQVTPYRADVPLWGGELSRVQVGSGQRHVSFSLRFVGSEAANAITGWWLSRTPLDLTWNKATARASVWGCLVTNTSEPFMRQQDPGQLQLYRGVLQLTQVGGEPQPFDFGTPFTYDDSSLGLTDQTYNPMLP